MSPVSRLPADKRASTDKSAPSGRRRPVRRVVIILIAAVLVSVLAAVTMIGLATFSKSLAWSVIGGVLAAVLASWLLGFLIWRGDTTHASPLRRLIFGPLIILGCAAVVSVSWLYTGTEGVRPDPISGVEWLDRPDGTRLALHVTRAAAATRPPIIFVHGGPGVADMAHDAPAFAALGTDRDVYVYDRVGTGASSRLADPTGYTTARAVEDLEAVRVHTGAARVVLLGHSWGARITVSYAQEHRDHVAALVLIAPGELPLEGADVPPGDLTTRLETPELVKEYLRLLGPRNLFAYALTNADPRVAHSVAGDREMDRRFSVIYRESTPALFCDERLIDRVGTTGVGYYAHYVPQLRPDPADVPLRLDQLAMIKVPVLVIKPACDYVAWSAVVGYRHAFPQAELVMIPDAGHVVYLEQPVLHAALVRAFLSGQKLPLPTIDGTNIPDDYRGTR
jgi:proline iminopeptidase